MPSAAIRGLGCIGVLIVIAGGCRPLPSDLPGNRDVAPGWQAEFVASGLPPVSALAAAEDGRLFFAERSTGQIRVVRDGILQPEPFAVVPVNAAGERGLLGLAIHPRFDVNRRVYACYTRSDTGLTTDDPRAVLDLRIVYFEAAQDSDVAVGGEVFVATFPVGTGTRRLGGQIAFAPDRTLYLLLGDGGGPDLAQDPEFFFGKILRLSDDGTIPDDNPTANSALFARGLRAPRGIAFDPIGGFGFFADDSGTRHEVNRIVPGANYGWPAVSGVASTAAEREFARNTASYRDPILATDTAIVGAAFNPSNRYGLAVAGRMLYGADDLGQVRALSLSESRLLAAGTAAFIGNLPGEIRAVAFTPAGTLYVATGSSIVRIVEYRR